MVTPVTEITMDIDNKSTSSNLSISATSSDIHNKDEFNKLGNKWNLWAHLPHETDWSTNSYKKIYKFETVEETIAITESLPESLIKNCMLFIMKD